MDWNKLDAFVESLAAGSGNPMIASTGRLLAQRREEEAIRQRKAAEARAELALRMAESGALDPAQAQGLLSGSDYQGVDLSGLGPQAKQSRETDLLRSKLQAYNDPSNVMANGEDMGPIGPSLNDLIAAQKLGMEQPEIDYRHSLAVADDERNFNQERQRMGIQHGLSKALADYQNKLREDDMYARFRPGPATLAPGGMGPPAPGPSLSELEFEEQRRLLGEKEKLGQDNQVMQLIKSLAPMLRDNPDFAMLPPQEQLAALQQLLTGAQPQSGTDFFTGQ